MSIQEEIQKIVGEYAIKNRSALVPAGSIDFIINDFIEQLSKDYCIVPKSTVIGLWDEINNDAKINIENGFPDYAEFNKLQLTPIELLFGKDMFEEDKS